MLSRFLSALIHGIDRLSEWTGWLMAWSLLLLVGLTVYDVFMRKFFAVGSITIQELEWHLFALSFLLGAAYTLKHDGHVRVDALYHAHHISPRQHDWINLIGGILFLMPFCLLVIYNSLPFVYNAYLQHEISPDGGLPHRWLIKAAIPLGFSLLLLQGLAETLRSGLRLLKQYPEAS